MATTADTSQASLKFIPETIWGEVPSSGNMNALRFTGESLSLDKSTTISDEIDDGEQIADLISTSIKTSGDIDGEVSYGAYDAFMESSLRNTWGSDINSSVTGVSVNATGKMIYPSGNLPSFQVGQAIRLAGFTTSENNRTVVITAIANSTRIVTVAPPLVQETATAGAVVAKGAVLTNGSEIKSFSIEKEFGDVNKFFLFTGMVADTMSISVEADSKITTKFGFMGKDSESAATTSNPGTLTPAPSNDVMNGSTANMLAIEGSTTLAYIKSISVETNNGLRSKPVISQKSSKGVSKSRMNVTGSLMLYFTDFSIYQKFRDNSATSLTFSILDSSGEYVVYLPSVKFTETKIVSGGADQDVMVEGGYQALKDPITNKSILITKISN